jgi:heme/copper-type cytochrome/quinol oxidase subunit 2
VVHGFHLEGYDLEVTIPPLSREVELRRGGTTETVEEVVLHATRAGKFRYRCSTTCGAMHPFMVGELVVGPNRLFQASSLAAATLLLVTLGAGWRPARREERR